MKAQIRSSRTAGSDPLYRLTKPSRKAYMRRACMRPIGRHKFKDLGHARRCDTCRSLPPQCSVMPQCNENNVEGVDFGICGVRHVDTLLATLLLLRLPLPLLLLPVAGVLAVRGCFVKDLCCAEKEGLQVSSELGLEKADGGTTSSRSAVASESRGLVL